MKKRELENELRDTRKNWNLTVEEAAEITGFSAELIEEIENGKKEVGEELTKYMSKLLLQKYYSSRIAEHRKILEELHNPKLSDSLKEKIERLEEQHKTEDDLFRTILNSTDEEIIHSDFYLPISRYHEHGMAHWYTVRKMFGDKRRYILSDAGSILIGNEHFSIRISHGGGDGEARFAVLEEDEFLFWSMNFETYIEGDNIHIYHYDCGNPNDMDNVVKTISGKFAVYTYNGLVAFVRCK